MQEHKYISCKELRFAYDQFTLDIDELSVDKGEIIAITGKSGSGKSTFFSLLSGFLQPQSGNILIDNHDYSQIKPFKRPIAYLFQDHNLFEHLQVWQNIGFALHPGLKLNKDDIQKIHEILSVIGLPNAFHKLPSELSGGERQRIALARILLQRKPILLLDEGFTGVDSETKKNLIQFIKSIQQTYDLTILFISHDQEEIDLFDAREIVFSAGNIVT